MSPVVSNAYYVPGLDRGRNAFETLFRGHNALQKSVGGNTPKWPFFMLLRPNSTFYVVDRPWWAPARRTGPSTGSGAQWPQVGDLPEMNPLEPLNRLELALYPNF